MGALRDENFEVRAAGALALAAIGDPSTVAPLIATYLDEPDADVREAIAYALGELGDSRAVEPLMRGVADVDGFARYQAVAALGKLGDVRALPALREIPEDAVNNAREGYDVREAAALAIRLIGERQDEHDK
jgi:HEAT repeat protein